VAIDARSRPVESLRIEVPAVAERLAEIRRQLAGWLEPIGVSSSLVSDVVLVVNEACTNCIEHAYRGIEAGPMCVEANLVHGQIVVDISDNGVWQPPPSQPGTRGRGVAIMRAVSAEVDVQTSTEGTTVRMKFDATPQGSSS
jgi:anti-sigma regulatory factor (Ser/Thr protein kinase)